MKLLYCYSASLCLAQTQLKKRKFFGEDKSEPSSQNTSKTSKIEAPQIIMIEYPYDSSKPATCISKPRHIPKSTPGEPMEQIELIVGDASKNISIDSELENPLKQKLIDLLQGYSDMFAWKPEDMPDLDEIVAVHKLHIDPKVKTVKLKRRNFSPERQQVIDEEVNKLLEEYFIYEIQFPEWITMSCYSKYPVKNGEYV